MYPLSRSHTCSVSTKLATFPPSSMPRRVYRVPCLSRLRLETNITSKLRSPARQPRSTCRNPLITGVNHRSTAATAVPPPPSLPLLCRPSNSSRSSSSGSKTPKFQKNRSSGGGATAMGGVPEDPCRCAPPPFRCRPSSLARGPDVAVRPAPVLSFFCWCSFDAETGCCFVFAFRAPLPRGRAPPETEAADDRFPDGGGGVAGVEEEEEEEEETRSAWRVWVTSCTWEK